MKQFTDEQKTIFLLGVNEGERRAAEQQRACNVMSIANRELMEIIAELDRSDPVVGVMLTFAKIKMVIRALKRKTASPGLAKDLELRRDEAKRRNDVVTALIEGNLDK